MRNSAQSALPRLGDGVIPQLIAASQNQRANVRASVAWILAELQLPGEVEKTVPVLITLLRDKETSVRRKAAWSLARHGPRAKPAIPDLIEALKDPDKVPDTKDVSVSQAAALSLGKLGPAAKDAIRTDQDT